MGKSLRSVNEHKMKPEYISGKSAWVENIPFAFDLVNKVKPDIIVELGVHYGDSYFAFCQAIKKLGLDTSIFGIDIFEGDDLTGYYGTEVYKQVSQYNEEHYKDFSTLICNYFDLALPQFKDSSIDILHIDGSHYYVDVKHDFETWLTKVNKGGIILFHDIKVMREPYGVWRFWKELKAGYKTEELDNEYGLGVLYV